MRIFPESRNFVLNMEVTVVGEDNAEAYARSIIEDLLDWIVVNYRVNKDFKLLEEMIEE